MTVIPRRHAVACIREMRRDIEINVYEMYNAERYKLVYDRVITQFSILQFGKLLNTPIFFPHITREA